MLNNYSKSKPHKSKLKTPIVLLITCTIILSCALWTNSIAKSYDTKINNLTAEIKNQKVKAKELETENKAIENSIEELNSLIKEIESELN